MKCEEQLTLRVQMHVWFWCRITTVRGAFGIKSACGAKSSFATSAAALVEGECVLSCRRHGRRRLIVDDCYATSAGRWCGQIYVAK
eukprot:1071613-Ditylum_brightwellii.AAC.1